MTLQARYSVQVLFVIIVSVVGLSLATVWQLVGASHQVETIASESLATHLEQEVRERGHVISEYLVQNLPNAIVRFDFTQIRDLLRTTISQQGVTFVYVFDAQGAVLHDGTNAVHTYGTAVDSLLGWDASAEAEPAERQMADTLHVVQPIRVGSETIGGIAVGLSLGEIGAMAGSLRATLDDLGRTALRQQLFMAVAFAILFLLGGIWVALVSGRRLAKPIRDLAEHARLLGKGDFERKIDVSRNDEVGDLAAAFSAMRRDLKSTHNEARFLAYHDTLTGLPNRAGLIRAIEQLCTRCAKDSFAGALLFIDLNDFKPVNDTFGHEAGDALLVEAAARLVTRMGEDPFRQWNFGGSAEHSVGRLGGDEFIILLERIGSSDDSANVAEAMFSELSRPFEVQGHEVTIGASIGVALFPGDATDGNELLSHADVAMYTAKRDGKHAYRFYEPSMFERTRDRLFMVNDLRRALDGDGFEVHYQPIVSASDGSMVGAEALLRWRHPDRGLIRAAEFITVAERSGEIDRVGLWVLQRVCDDLASWRRHGLEGIFVSINISSTQLLRSGLPDVAADLLARQGLRTNDLHIEANEDRLVSGDTSRWSILQGWNQAGHEIWIDRFGCGPASLLNLQRLPVRGIKLSPEFISGIESDLQARQFVGAVIDLAGQISLDVCAVGVSSACQADWLRERGCRYLEGEYVGREICAAEVVNYVQARLNSDGSSESTPSSHTVTT